MEILSIALMFIAGIWGGIYLIVNDHPWFGLFILIITSLIRYSSKEEDESKKETE